LLDGSATSGRGRFGDLRWRGLDQPAFPMKSGARQAAHSMLINGRSLVQLPL